MNDLDGLRRHEDFFASHAISMEVAAARPYIRFEKGDMATVTSVNASFPANVKRLATTVAGQSGGYVITRNGFTQTLPPQLRPDESVYTSNLRKPSYHPLNATSRYVLTQKGQKVFALTGTQRLRHIERHHPECNVEGLHFHRHCAKYVLPPGSCGKRLDVHPLAWEKISKSKRVFFVIEGSLKNDAILSQGEAVFCVPSVTLWDAPELRMFIAAYLRDKDVVIVPDADWYSNPLVIAQAMMCRTYLRSKGVRACVAAPPLVNSGVEQHQTVGPLKGVDDYLAAGRSLDDLDVIEREATTAAEAWAALQSGYRRDRLARNVKALSTLPLYADANGEMVKSLQAFSRILRCDRKTAKRAIEDLAGAGAITVEGDLSADYQWMDAEGTVHDYDFDDPPRITFDEQFRATETTLKLNEWSATTDGDQVTEQQLQKLVVEPLSKKIDSALNDLTTQLRTKGFPSNDDFTSAVDGLIASAQE